MVNNLLEFCSFCNKEDDGSDPFLTNDAKTACVCQSCAKLFTRFVQKHSKPAKPQNSVGKDPSVEVFLLGNSSKLQFALFYVRSQSNLITWAYYCGDDGVGGFDSGYMKLSANKDVSDFKSHYFSYDGEFFHQDAISDEEVEIVADNEDMRSFDLLREKYEILISYDEDKDSFSVQDCGELNQMNISKQGTFNKITSSNFDYGLAEVLDKWPLKFHF